MPTRPHAHPHPHPQPQHLRPQRSRPRSPPGAGRSCGSGRAGPRLRCRAGAVTAHRVRSCRCCVGPQMEPPPGAAGRGCRRAGERARGRERGREEGRTAGRRSVPQTYSLHPRLPLPHRRSPRRGFRGKPPSLSAGPSHPPERAVTWAAAHRRWMLARATLGGSGPASARFPADWDVPAALSGLPAASSFLPSLLPWAPAAACGAKAAAGRPGTRGCRL